MSMGRPAGSPLLSGIGRYTVDQVVGTAKA
jgi:hypothetical protein